MNTSKITNSSECPGTGQDGIVLTHYDTDSDERFVVVGCTTCRAWARAEDQQQPIKHLVQKMPSHTPDSRPF